MNPIYLDLHIHTSENPNKLNNNYDVRTLIEKVKEMASSSNFLISLTDHNAINKNAYMELMKIARNNILLGTELHISNYEGRPPYHCHIFFDLEINSVNIDTINGILDELYPEKIINAGVVAPSLEKIIRGFDKYDYLLLPHGGQSHSTFDKSIDGDTVFDTTLERSIYYNQFDGFTARDNNGLEETRRYFKRLGINEFVNLMTCTDNYNPNNYPNAKAKEASEFLPTWMLAKPTFNGLRLSLSESSRLIYSKEKPPEWSEHIKKVFCCNEKIDIDVNLSEGLNVVIGGSSSGKTLFVDSLYRKIDNNFNESDYKSYCVEQLNVDNPTGCKPHYISQNYIMKVVDQRDAENKIEDIEIIGKVFPGNENVDCDIRVSLEKLKSDLRELIQAVKTVDDETKTLSHIPKLSMLLVNTIARKNLISALIPSQDDVNNIKYNDHEYQRHKQVLNEIDELLQKNPFVQNKKSEIELIKQNLDIVSDISKFENDLRNIIEQNKKRLDTYLASENLGQQDRLKDYETLLESARKYSNAFKIFEEKLLSIASYSKTFATQEIESMGHKLFIENNFEITREKFVEIANKFLKSDRQIRLFSDIRVQTLFEENFKKQQPKIKGYDDFESRVYSEFEKLNHKIYRIITSEGKEFQNLSAGWKTSILLDLILGYDGDTAPLIIDQPEDNLATTYINHGLIEAIKHIKARKQVILVSHNATIPMLGDAQTIVLCRNNGKILIRSAELEGQIDDKNIVDYIAEITDGGKPAIKKRVKKYNLKKFKEA